MKKTNIYCGKVDSQGGSKISLLNLIFLLSEEDKAINVFVGNKGWFTDKLEEKGISYILVKEPSVFQKSHKETNLIWFILLIIFSFPSLLSNWIKLCSKIKKEDNIVINEPRDLLAFFPFIITKKGNVIQWIRSEHISLIGRLISKRASKVIAVTNIVKKNIETTTWRGSASAAPIAAGRP